MNAKTLLRGALKSLLNSCDKYKVDFNELLDGFTDDRIEVVRGAHIDRLKIRPKITIYRRTP